MKFERDKYGLRVWPGGEAERKAWLDDRDKRARESYLRVKARKEAELKSLNLQITDIPADVLAAIELDCRRYREVRIAAALRRIGEAKLEAEKN